MQLKYGFDLFVGFEFDGSLNAATTLLRRLNQVESWRMATIVEDKVPGMNNDNRKADQAIYVFSRANSEANCTIDECYSPGFDFSAEAERILDELRDLHTTYVQLKINHKYGTFFPTFEHQRNFEIVAEMDQPDTSLFDAELTGWKVKLQLEQLIERRDTEDESRAYAVLSLNKVISILAKHGMRVTSTWRTHELALENRLTLETSQAMEIIVAEQTVGSRDDMEKIAWNLAAKTSLIKELARSGRSITIHLERTEGQYGAERCSYIYAQTDLSKPASEVLLNLIAS